MKTFKLQVDATAPDGWVFAKGTDERNAVVKAAAKAGVGTHMVYVANGGPKLTHPNGAPMVVQGYKVEVTKENP